ncbi:MAG: SRPBCC family protein [Acidobacteriota bacterium]
MTFNAPPIEIERHGSTYTLTTEQWLPRSLDELFPFYADAYNLERITPPILRFRVITPRPIEMKAGALIDYRLRLRGLPIRWRTRIAAWEPPYRFFDEQIRGPYRLWYHQHTFEERDGGTLVRDQVDYRMLFGRLAHPLIVGRDVRRIFAFRSQALAEIFGRDAAA